MVDDSDIAVHELPVWRERADHMLQADLSEHGLPGRYEQLWARKLNTDAYELCCLPFFTYGYALGDTVGLRTATAPFERVLGAVIHRSGRSVLRVAVRTRDLHADLHAAVAASNRPHEWRSGGLVSIDIEREVPEALWSAVKRLASEGHVEWEWGSDPPSLVRER